MRESSTRKAKTEMRPDRAIGARRYGHHTTAWDFKPFEFVEARFQHPMRTAPARCRGTLQRRAIGETRNHTAFAEVAVEVVESDRDFGSTPYNACESRAALTA